MLLVPEVHGEGRMSLRQVEPLDGAKVEPIRVGMLLSDGLIIPIKSSVVRVSLSLKSAAMPWPVKVVIEWAVTGVGLPIGVGVGCIFKAVLVRVFSVAQLK